MQVKSMAEEIFFSTIRIDTTSPDGGQGSGTGFVFSHDPDDHAYMFVVTNKHVVEGMKWGRLTFTKMLNGEPAIGQGFTMNIGPDDWPKIWYGHPDPNIDITVCPLVPLLDFAQKEYGIDVFIRSVSTTMIPSAEQADELDAIEPIMFVGYPNGIWDKKNLLPIARRGTTASPMSVDFEGTPRFLIDASVFGGSSGSPVFILNQGSYSKKSGALVAGHRLYFVGVVAAVFFRTQLNQIIPVPIPTQTLPMAEQQEMIDLGIVFKAHTVVEAIVAFLQSKGVAI